MVVFVIELNFDFSRCRLFYPFVSMAASQKRLYA